MEKSLKDMPRDGLEGDSRSCDIDNWHKTLQTEMAIYFVLGLMLNALRLVVVAGTV